MPSASMPFMSSVLAMTTLWPMTFLAILPVCLGLMVKVLQLLLMLMLDSLYFIASMPSISAEQVAAKADGASARNAAATRILRIMEAPRGTGDLEWGTRDWEIITITLCRTREGQRRCAWPRNKPRSFARDGP